MPVNPKVQEFYDKNTAYQDEADTAIDGALADAVATAALIAELQARPDVWTQEDQDLLDKITQRQGAQVDKLKALDAMNPPTPPPNPV
jgi:hypothetical protein